MAASASVLGLHDELGWRRWGKRNRGRKDGRKEGRGGFLETDKANDRGEEGEIGNRTRDRNDILKEKKIHRIISCLKKTAGNHPEKV